MPPPILSDFSTLLLRDLEGFQREIALFPDDESLWQTLPGVSNAAGNLALHIAGNIQHFIGHLLGGMAYARDRDAEFSRRSGTRAEVIAELGRAITSVREVMPRVSPEQLEATCDGIGTPAPVTVQRFLLHLCTHVAFHLGQAGYLRRIVTGDTRSTNTVSSARLT